MSEDTKRDKLDLLLRSVSRDESDDSRTPTEAARVKLVRVVSRVTPRGDHGEGEWVALRPIGRVSLRTEYELTLVPGPDMLQ